MYKVEKKEIRRGPDGSLGMSIKTRDGTCGQLTVHSVQPFGPAQRIGIRRGHVIVARKLTPPQMNEESVVREGSHASLHHQTVQMCCVEIVHHPKPISCCRRFSDGWRIV